MFLKYLQLNCGNELQDTAKLSIDLDIECGASHCNLIVHSFKEQWQAMALVSKLI